MIWNDAEWCCFVEKIDSNMTFHRAAGCLFRNGQFCTSFYVKHPFEEKMNINFQLLILFRTSHAFRSLRFEIFNSSVVFSETKHFIHSANTFHKVSMVRYINAHEFTHNMEHGVLRMIRNYWVSELVTF